MIPLGFEKKTAETVSIPVIHSVFAGITRAGKSETVKAAIARSSNDVRFLILDVKRPRDYASVGIEVPIYIEEKTEPLMLKRLLESQSHLALKFEFPELLKVCKKASTYPDILAAVNEGLEAKKHPIVKDKLLVLQHLLTRLVRELEKTEISDDLVLKSRINVMNLSMVSKEMQQLAVHSTLKRLMESWADVVVIADEFHRFAPQYGSNASKETVTNYIKEGGAKRLWLWVIDQTITGVDKQVLKQCWVWVLGKQREVNEAKRTLDQIPFKTGLTEKAIMRLKTGHFIVCTEDFAKLTYVWLPEVNKDLAQAVARGQIDVREVMERLKEKIKEDDDLVYKEKCEQLERAREVDAEAIKTLQKQVESITTDWQTAKEQSEACKKENERLNKDIIEFRKLGGILAKLLPKKELSVGTKTRSVHLASQDMLVTVHDEGVEKVEMSTSNIEGKLLLCALEDLPREGFRYTEIKKAMAERGWPVKKSTLSAKLSIMTGEALLIKIDDGYRLPDKVKLVKA